METEKIIAYIISIFDLNSLFVMKKYDEKNNKAFEKIIKCLLFNKFYNNSYLVSNDLKKFIKVSLFKKESLIVLNDEKTITDFIISYNYFRGYIPFKKCYESHKFNYISLLGTKNNKFLFVSIKSNLIDKCKTYIIVNKNLYESVMNNYDITDSFTDFKLDIFNNCLIKDTNLKVPKNYKINLETIIDIFYSYKKSLKIDNETYSLKLNEYDNTNYLRFLVSDYFDYYSKKGSLKEFYEYLTDYKGLKLDLTLNEWFKIKTTVSNYDYISLVYYIQFISFIESNKHLYKDTFSFMEYKKFLDFIIELRDKNIKFEKTLILFILDNKTHIRHKQLYKEFLDSL